MQLVLSNGVVTDNEALELAKDGGGSIFAYDAEKQIGIFDFRLLLVRHSDLFFFDIFYNKKFSPKTFKHYGGLMSWVNREQIEPFHIVPGFDFFDVKTTIVNEYFKA